MTSNQSPFRKKSLERLSSPDQLDALMTVTSTRSWGLLGGIVLVLIAVFVWIFVGTLREEISAKGILVKNGGVVGVVSAVSGTVAKIYVKPGQIVQSGDLLALISRPELQARLSAEKTSLFALENEQKALGSFQRMQEEKELSRIKRHYLLVENSVNAAVTAVEKQAKLVRSLEAQGETSDPLITARNALEVARSNYIAALHERHSLDTDRLSLLQQIRSESRVMTDRIDETRQRILPLQTAYKIYAPYSGRVIEITQDETQIAQIGSPLLKLERLSYGAKNLRAVLYLPTSTAKKIRAGMGVQIYPSTLSREVSGSMIGVVRSVSEFPVSEPGMMRILNDEHLVEKFSKDGHPIEVTVDFVEKTSSKNGYHWSSKAGESAPIHPGTLCDAVVIVSQKRPLELAFPHLFLGN